jgi:hypothetical protein
VIGVSLAVVDITRDEAADLLNKTHRLELPVFRGA